MPSSKSTFDESKPLPEQRKALEFTKAQSVEPIRSIEELRLDIEADELEQFADGVPPQIPN
jgi:hypothetical protein